MKRLLACLCIVFAINNSAEAQTKYIVRFRDKATNTNSLNDPSGFLSQKAIQRRTNHSIPYDSTDLPVTLRYIDSILSSGAVTVLNVSKWLNSVSIQTTDVNALNKINSFPFVISVNGIAAKTSGLFPERKKFIEGEERPASFFKQAGILSDHFDYGFSFNQVSIHNGQFLHNIGLRGQGMTIGMLDAGFQSYLTLKAFDSVRINGQILGVYDFVAKDNSVNEDHPHGMQCFSTISANIPGQFVGTAPKASFYLFRSENSSSEFPVEEFNWVCAAERVDSSGGDVISSSLGYNTFDSPFENYNHSYEDMDGNTTMAAIGADLAAKKGILVINSAGNEGGNSWGKIITPADGDSVLAVGAVNSDSIPAGFSSRGPSSDGQVKPEAVSVGVNTIVQLTNNNIGTNSGTSFSAPNLAGLSTCLWQGFPEFNNMKVIDAIKRSGNRYNDPNDIMGYGIPDMKKAFMILLKDYSLANGNASNCITNINWTSKDTRNMRYEIERKVQGQTSFLKIKEFYGSGNELQAHNYNFSEDLKDLPSGTIIYRIRQVIDTNAAGFFADYIDTVSVVSNISCVTADQVSLLPNPSAGPLTIKISTLTEVPNLTIRIFNSKGQLATEMKRSQMAGTSFYELPVHHLAGGKYYVTVYKGQELFVTKELIKL
jgi:serine protease AprX